MIAYSTGISRIAWINIRHGYSIHLNATGDRKSLLPAENFYTWQKISVGSRRKISVPLMPERQRQKYSEEVAGENL